MDTRIDIRGLSFEELSAALVRMGEKAFRAKQIFSWVHEKNVSSFYEMKNIGKALINKLDGEFCFTRIELVIRQVDEEDLSEKYLFNLDGEYIETVVMRYKDHTSICLSSQAGCVRACTFCASGKNGLSRNLSAGEIVSQLYFAQNIINERISHIVYMGTGEPLDNFQNLIKSIDILSDERGKNISKRNITVSTCGVVPKIYDLADINYPITFALSLHSTSDENRSKTMPVNDKYNISKCLDALEYYYSKTRRRISFEYALIQGVNDSLDESIRLVSLLKARSFTCHVNLILVNNVVENYYTKPSKKDVKAFMDKLKQNGIETTLRRSVGKNIDGACGQLRLRKV